MSEILIVARTRMKHPNICVGAIDMTSGRMIRPLTDDGRHFIDRAPWTPGDIWRVKYSAQDRVASPHVEDVRIHRMEHIGMYDDMGSWIRANRDRIAIHTGPAEHLFDGALTFEPFKLGHNTPHPRSARLDEGQRLPSMSLQLWKSDRLLVQHSVQRDGAWHIRYDGGCPSATGVSFSVKHVGFRAEPVIIPPGTIISLSLARWWSRPDRSDDRKACYLQFCDVIAEPLDA